MKNIIIIGAGGFGREVEWLIERINNSRQEIEWNILGYADDNLERGTRVGNSKVICSTDELLYYDEEVSIVIAVGNAVTRKKIYDKIKENTNITFPNIIDPSVIGEASVIGEGNIICAGTIITVNVTIGNFNIINLHCTIGHDDVLKDFITVYPGVNISGCVNVDSFVEIGTGTKIIQQKDIKDNIIVGAGAVIVNDLNESGTYVGVPARKK